MNMKQISIGSDHRGFALKEYLKQAITSVEWSDVGPHDDKRSDYPIFAQAVCHELKLNKAEEGVLICGSGIGMSIAANRHSGIYAGLCLTEENARDAREEDGINVLVLAADLVSPEAAVQIVKAWLGTEFKGGRYQDRLDMLD